MLKKFPTMLIAALLVTILVAGCGDDGADSGTSASGAAALADGSSGEAARDGEEAAASEPGGAAPLEKAEFVKRANTICTRQRAKMLEELEALAKDVPLESEIEEELARKAPRLVFIPGVEAHIAGIRELGAPAGDEEKVEGLLIALEEGVESARKQPVASTEQFANQFRAFDVLARDYGIAGCDFGSGRQ